MEGADIRPVHIVYFLSWLNRVEHPHLIRVNHLIHSDIRLPDVKRWLSDFRGKNMPDSFAWSCKRRYKMGYVWQDLMDDDVVTPISDQEYVLKGSLISTATPCDSCSSRNQLQKLLNAAIPNRKATNIEIPHTKPSQPGLTAESETSGTTDESFRQETDYSMTTVSEIEEEVIDEVKNRSSCSSMASSSMMKNDIVERDELLLLSPQPQYSSPKRKNCSSLTSNVLLNILTCGVIETNDSAMKLVNKNSSSPLSDVARKGPQHHNNNWGSCLDGVRNLKESSEFSMRKTCSTTSKPAMEPNCSQCGKGFKPEKLHKHMKFCRGMKNQSKTNSTSSIAERMSAEFF